MTVGESRDTAAPTDEDACEIMLLASRMGELLLRSGAPAADVVTTVTGVAAAFGLRDCAVDVTSGSLTLSYRSGPRAAPLTEVRIVRSAAPGYGRIEAVHRLADRIGENRLDLAAAASRLTEIETARPAHPAWQVTLSWAFLGGFFTVMLGGGLVVFAAAAAVTAFIDLAGRRLARRGVPAFHQAVLGGAVATAVATGLFLTGATNQAPLIVAGGIAVLLPGLAFVGAVQDAIAGYLVTAAARAMEVAVVVAAIVAGVGAVLYAAARADLRVPPVQPGAFTPDGWAGLPVQVPAAMMVCVCFAFSVQAARWTMLTAGLAGGGGWTVYLVLWQEYDLPPALAAAVAAILIGLGGHAYARRTDGPALPHTVAGIAPLAPGYTIYQGLLDLSHGQAGAGFLAIGQAATIGLAIAGGLSLGRVVVDRPASRNR
ncbi:membrane protein [Microtetraspora sp. NBRC 13810]|uniref:threonine/serine ThrE exporter family protein n=1 Tax=Microtetraspora sp. NBRC 13810 TaxID=3030990 RepID=UPI0024A125B6|nr:threonine/serine exporter family protein [Microtetraspora sp. NBRC 13810]GLW12758.1 membrane protein [Microtetraspora sp. NBRC 13810]